MGRALLLALIALFANAQTFDVWSARATEAREANRLDEAIEHYQKALKLKPAWGEGWWYLGTIHYEADRYQEARDAFRRATSLEPKNGPAWVMLGLCEYQTREYDRALEHLQKGRGIGIGDNRSLEIVSKYHTALLLTRFENYESALDLLFQFSSEGNTRQQMIEATGIAALRMPFLPLELPPDKREIVLLAGRAVYAAGGRRIEEAGKAYEALVARYPNAPNVHYLYGAFLLHESPDKGIPALQKELEITPNHVPARVHLAFEYLRRGEPETAAPFAQKAVELAPDSFAAHTALGRIYTEQGKVAEAVKVLETAVKLAPESPESRYALAAAYARAGREKEAARERAVFVKLNEARKR
jgi:tetratricopeptide (TPR) repeat protein